MAGSFFQPSERICFSNKLLVPDAPPSALQTENWMQTSFYLFAYFLQADESIFLDMGSWWSWSVDISIFGQTSWQVISILEEELLFSSLQWKLQKNKSSVLWPRIILICTQQKLQEVFKMSCFVLQCFISWALSPHENYNNYHDLALSHSTFPTNAYCFCQFPVLY